MDKRAVIYGAGNIGRGFAGQLLYEAGYATAFIDVNKDLIALLNEKKEYPVRLVDNESEEEVVIKNVRGVDGSPENSDEISEIISQAGIMATAVGANILKHIMKPVAGGINRRFANGNLAPLNIILCENLIGADKIMRGGVLEYIDDKYKNLYEEKIGFIEASVGRMVPIQTESMKKGDPLRIVCEKYKYIYVDRDGFKGEIPEINNIIPYSPFEYHIERKLFIHNMGHTLCAYLGDIRYINVGYDFIWQAVQDPYIKTITKKAMECSALALSKIYGADINELNGYIGDLLRRFENKALGDTVKRVGGDLKRKLAPDDRIIGSYKICLRHSLPAQYMCLAIAAAANFKGDPLSGLPIEEILREAGSYDLLAGNPGTFSQVIRFDNAIKSGAGIEKLYDML